MDDFSTNRHAENNVRIDSTMSLPTRHPDLSFSDGNIVLVAGDFYFNVHKGLLCRHSTPLSEIIHNLEAEDKHPCLIEGNVVLELDDNPKDLCRFLMALYDGVYVFLFISSTLQVYLNDFRSGIKHDNQDFENVSALLRLATKYGVDHIRNDILRGMSVIWPKTLSAWEFREADATDATGVYKPRAIYPHPMLVAIFFDI